MKLFAFLCCICLVLGLPIDDPQLNEETTVKPPADESLNESNVPASLNLPSNAASIRADITDTFSCQDRIYGYYADVENDCQIFHICLPVTYADGKEKTFRWSFVCPDETIFSQEHFTCIRPADWAGSCADSEKFVELNQQFGKPSENADIDNETTNKDSPQPEADVDQSNESAARLDTVPASLVSGPIEEAVIPAETKSYGIFNVLQTIDNQSDAETYDEIEVIGQHRDHIETTSTTEAVPTTTDESSYQSTASWNVYTESLYDGFTIDDNVEVDAVEVTEESSSSVPANDV